MASPAEEIRRQLEESARVKQSFSNELIGRVAQFAEKSAAALRAGGKIVFFGNGGSAADALHLAAELLVRLRTERPGLAALALTTNPSVLTAAGNDYGFERIFSRQIESLVAKQDILVALESTTRPTRIIPASGRLLASLRDCRDSFRKADCPGIAQQQTSAATQ